MEFDGTRLKCKPACAMDTRRESDRRTDRQRERERETGECVSIGVHACTRVTRGAYTKGVNGNAKSLFNFDRRSCKPRYLAGINPDPVAKYELMMLSCSTNHPV